MLEVNELSEVEAVEVETDDNVVVEFLLTCHWYSPEPDSVIVEVEGLLMIIEEEVIVPNVDEAIVPVGAVVSTPNELLPELNWVNVDVPLE